MFNVNLAAAADFAPAIGYVLENTIKLSRLRSLIAVDLVGDVEVVGRRGGWVVSVSTGELPPPMLATAAGAVRVFTTSDSAIHQLIRLGITKFQCTADEYESGTLRAPRPDRSAVLRQQTEYDAWFKAKIAAVHARIEAGTEPMLTPSEAWVRVQERIAFYEKGGQKE